MDVFTLEEIKRDPIPRLWVEKVLLMLLLIVGVVAIALEIARVSPAVVGRDRHWEAFEPKLARFDQYPKIIKFLADDEAVRQSLRDGAPIRIVAVNRITGEVLLPEDP